MILVFGLMCILISALNLKASGPTISPQRDSVYVYAYVAVLIVPGRGAYAEVDQGSGSSILKDPVSGKDLLYTSSMHVLNTFIQTGWDLVQIWEREITVATGTHSFVIRTKVPKEK